ncbi:arfGAP with FG repeats 1 S homeolog isoform X3 [Xenopus laevis]|uniref:Arf-GAP domain and FG repeat-containing protein 1 n=1 Tax=Xenopus laevis TaxID=8355 RepID=A0A8J1KRJ9_XENLA|nr:arfGAP with FG repeats 1 S homeolog isoform X3 [Xenopus laevis]
MAASAKRKQEEKHLKMLREMTSLPHNRKCFDCDQRGPTYANMTTGAFVCTSCSGILRGLNPPHRVKSISMTTFTQQEIEFLQKHGNDVCKQIWLGLFDDRSSAIPDFRDPQKVKEFLQEKYEKKRWYVPPEQAKVVASVHASISGSSASSTSSTPEVKPLKTLLGDGAPALQLNKGTPSQSPVVTRNQVAQAHQEKKQFDLLSDLGTDIFATPASQPTATANFANFANFNNHTAHNSAHADFANFDAFGQSSGVNNFGAFPPSSQTPTPPLNTAFRTLSSSCSFADFTSAFSLQTTHHRTNANANFAQFDNFPKSSSADFGTFNSTAHSAAPSKAVMTNMSQPTADKYAALADLDNIFGSVQGVGGGQSSSFNSTSVPASSGPAVPAPADNHVFGLGSAAHTHTVASAAGPFAAPASTNPFVSASVAPAVNPFQTNGRAPPGLQDGHRAEAPFHAFHQTRLATAAGALDACAGFAVFGQIKPVVTPFGQVSAPGVSSNPFMAGAPSGQFPTGSSSTNPFL